MSEIFEYKNGQGNLEINLALSLYELDKKFFPTPWSKDSWVQLFESQHVLYILSDKDSVLGFALFGVNAQDHFAHLLKILILPEFRQDHNGFRLLNYAVDSLRAMEFNRFYLEVERNNLPAIKLYESIHFVQIHLRKDFYGSGRDALIMCREN